MSSKYVSYKNFISILFDYMQGLDKIVINLEFIKRERKKYLDTIVSGPGDLPYAIESVKIKKGDLVDKIYFNSKYNFCNMLRDEVDKLNARSNKFKLDLFFYDENVMVRQD